MRRSQRIGLLPAAVSALSLKLPLKLSSVLALSLPLALALLLSPHTATPTAPCFHVCHLGQGQPLLLPDAGTLWTRRCTTPDPTTPETCVLERVTLEGRVLEQLPIAKSYDEHAFEDAHLR